ncbi:LacI family DNA-binding transcriptional regulator [Actinotalea sp. BY-33]|uniref:LacI family DNA-binding transcriptional regulator n=1 Tax=Actinotalea soli TaxID=2819234 RepID=A0A939LSP9_9CELL|nr:LacI family DNA-binding transcriptional regulator [Actinotalea soli]MBO1753434.1 LacI family DNA-binding transcriptional regulator [Actinotalea soli]
MSDVAVVAGVSHQTVSRVLNSHPSVRPETRQRVLEAIEQLGYRRNVAARALVTRRTGTLGVVTSGSALFGPTSTLIAIEEAAREAGYFVSLATVARWEVPALLRTLEHFMSQGVEGIVVVASHDDAADAVRGFESTVPVVMVGPEDLQGPQLYSVAVDQYAGARMAVQHLLDLGHRDIVHLAGPEDWFDARARARAWRDALVEVGVEARTEIAGDWRADRGYEVGLEVVAEGPPSAVFAANDQLALGLLRAFAERGLRVPEDVSVVGFDDVDGSANFYPPLTTVRQEFRTLGTRCLEVLLAAIEGETPSRQRIEPRLVVRASSGPARP